MKNFFFLLGLTFFSLSATAGDLSDQDAGTFVVLNQQRAPTDMFYRLSKASGKWIMEGKKSGASWANISCDSGCEYRVSSESEIQSFFPPDWRANSQIACIQNMAQAFCRYTSNQDPTKGGHVVIALVTGRPIPIFVRRVPS
ncbi:MAG: hypothetical protein Q8K23_12440 [Sulfuritalea sp.]|nr:hypothetical protein [Sulfuritalea sp.]